MKKKVMAGFMAGMMALGAMAGTVYADVTDYSDAVPAEVKGTDDVSVLEDEYTAKEKYKVGFALESMDVAVWNTMSEGMADEAEKIGVEYTCMVANNDVAAQVANVENMIARRIIEGDVHEGTVMTVDANENGLYLK